MKNVNIDNAFVHYTTCNSNHQNYSSPANFVFASNSMRFAILNHTQREHHQPPATANTVSSSDQS